MSTFDMRRLRYFLKIAESGSLTRAAEALRVAQPALSHHMRALEEEFGLQLIVRGSRGIQVTDAGARLVREATDLFEITRLIPDRVRQDDSALDGVVTIALGPSIGARLVAPLLASTAKRLPGVQLDIREHTIAHLPSVVRSGAVDLGLSYDTQGGSGLDVTKLVPEELGVIGTHALAARYLGRPAPKKVKLRDLAALPLHLALRSTRLRELVEMASQRAKVTLKIVTEVDSTHFMREIARNGIGFTILPKSNLASRLERGRLWWAPLDPPIVQTICLVVRSGRPLSRATQAVGNLATEAVTGGRPPRKRSPD